MEVLKTFRHELKFVISYDEMLRVREKLNQVLTIDRNENGYLLRSLYFDSLDDVDYYDKQGGEYKRKKIRLRTYDISSNKVKLEIKQKIDYHQLKESLVISKKDAKELMKENYDILLSYDDPVALKIYEILRTGCYKPKIIIEYLRVAYMSSTTTRITFDYNIKKCDDIGSFFKKNINYLDVTTPKDVVMEVKFDRFLEPYITEILSKYVSNYESVSKYIMGRNI